MILNKNKIEFKTIMGKCEDGSLPFSAECLLEFNEAGFKGQNRIEILEKYYPKNIFDIKIIHKNPIIFEDTLLLTIEEDSEINEFIRNVIKPNINNPLLSSLLEDYFLNKPIYLYFLSYDNDIVNIFKVNSLKMIDNHEVIFEYSNNFFYKRKFDYTHYKKIIPDNDVEYFEVKNLPRYLKNIIKENGGFYITEANFNTIFKKENDYIIFIGEYNKPNINDYELEEGGYDAIEYARDLENYYAMKN